MAIHNDLRSMSIEAIEEYLAIADHCVTARKAGGGAYGYPAVLLLFSVVDALTNYAGYPAHSFGAMKDIFPKLTTPQIKHLADWYRHLPAHQAIIMPGTQLTVESPGDPIELNSMGEPTRIRLQPFYDGVKTFWENFDMGRINPKFHAERAPKAPTPTTASPLTASGTFVTTSKE